MATGPAGTTARAASCRGCAGSTRRDFLALATAGLASVVFVEGRAGASSQEKRYPLPAADGVSIDRAAGVILVRTQDRVIAFNLACPHENYALRWRARDARFQCPEHESRYQPDGTFIDGRATRNMDRLAIRRDGAEVVVNLDVMYRSDRQAAEWGAAVVHVS